MLASSLTIQLVVCDKAAEVALSSKLAKDVPEDTEEEAHAEKQEDQLNSLGDVGEQQQKRYFCVVLARIVGLFWIFGYYLGNPLLYHTLQLGHHDLVTQVLEPISEPGQLEQVQKSVLLRWQAPENVREGYDGNKIEIEVTLEVDDGYPAYVPFNFIRGWEVVLCQEGGNY